MKADFSWAGAAQGPDWGRFKINQGHLRAPDRDADASAPL